jgi:exodeoxyribonuclease V alpha subunit
MAAALASSAVGAGHVCLDLQEVAGRELQLDNRRTVAPPLDDWRDALGASPAVGTPGDYRPLVLDRAGRLYLYRYWNFERELATALHARAQRCLPLPDEGPLREELERLFPASNDGTTDQQRAAAVAALQSGICVVSGGPGTGKTSTVAKILVLLLQQPGGEGLRIALAAPTGKAAARLKDSLRGAGGRLGLSEGLMRRFPEEVSTIHRLLGVMGGTGRCRYHAGNPLPHDLVVIDEASMVALPLMARLTEALRPAARLILLGDRDQLASVEAGAVLGDICGGDRSAVSLSPLARSLVMLRKNYRFGDDSGIGRISRLVNGGAGEEALALIGSGAADGIVWRDLPGAALLVQALAGPVTEGYGGYLAETDPARALALFDRFRLLCAVRQGPYGVESLNGIVEQALAGAGLIGHRERWYRGRPIMITANDYSLRLFNGDVGIIMSDGSGENALRAYFPAPDGGVRSFLPLRLPPHETAFAMTVHKSQGSEFDRVLMVLPDRDLPVVTRELVYTGITRARREVELWGNADGFVAGVARCITRRSGLRELLWGEEER